MSFSCGKFKNGQAGGARLKFLIILTILILAAYSGYQYIPVAIHAYWLKDLMQQTVNIAAVQQKPIESVRQQLREQALEHGAPPDVSITVEPQQSRMQARVQFTKPIKFPLYTYDYEFDHTVRSFDVATLR